MFIQNNYEKLTITHLYLYFNTLLKKKFDLSLNFILLKIYLILKNKFFYKYKLKFKLKDFFILISLEYYHFNIFNLLVLNSQSFIKYINKHLNKLLQFTFISVFDFINILYLYSFKINDFSYFSLKKTKK